MLHCLIISKYCEIVKLCETPICCKSNTFHRETFVCTRGVLSMRGPVDTTCRWIFHCQLPRTFGNTPSQMQPIAWCLYISGNGRCTCGFWTAKQTLSHIDLTVQIIQIEWQRDCWARQCDSNWNLAQCTSASDSIETWYILVCHMIPNLNAFQVVAQFKLYNRLDT